MAHAPLPAPQAVWTARVGRPARRLPRVVAAPTTKVGPLVDQVVRDTVGLRPRPRPYDKTPVALAALRSGSLPVGRPRVPPCLVAAREAPANGGLAPRKVVALTFYVGRRRGGTP